MGATVIYFGNRLCSGLNGDPQNVVQVLTSILVNGTLFGKRSLQKYVVPLICRPGSSLLLTVKAQPSITRQLETSEKSDRNLPKQ